MTAIIKGKHITGAARITPPATLSPAAKAVFVHIVANVDPSHFSKVDLPLVEAYANSAALATEAAQRIDADGAVSADGKLSPWLAVSEKAQKQLVALSARLRICPQSRFDRLGAGANSRAQPDGVKPWEWDKAPKNKYFDDLITR
jgi:phage terminase small subunit